VANGLTPGFPIFTDTTPWQNPTAPSRDDSAPNFALKRTAQLALPIRSWVLPWSRVREDREPGV